MGYEMTDISCIFPVNEVAVDLWSNLIAMNYPFPVNEVAVDLWSNFIAMNYPFPHLQCLFKSKLEQLCQFLLKTLKQASYGRKYWTRGPLLRQKLTNLGFLRATPTSGSMVGLRYN